MEIAVNKNVFCKGFFWRVLRPYLITLKDYSTSMVSMSHFHSEIYSEFVLYVINNKGICEFPFGLGR